MSCQVILNNSLSIPLFYVRVNATPLTAVRFSVFVEPLVMVVEAPWSHQQINGSAGEVGVSLYRTKYREVAMSPPDAVNVTFPITRLYVPDVWDDDVTDTVAPPDV
jgi:hypothetical protein